MYGSAPINEYFATPSPPSTDSSKKACLESPATFVKAWTGLRESSGTILTTATTLPRDVSRSNSSKLAGLSFEILDSTITFLKLNQDWSVLPASTLWSAAVRRRSDPGGGLPLTPKYAIAADQSGVEPQHSKELTHPYRDSGTRSDIKSKPGISTGLHDLQESMIASEPPTGAALLPSAFCFLLSAFCPDLSTILSKNFLSSGLAKNKTRCRNHSSGQRVSLKRFVRFVNSVCAPR
jgi:hypothetical protein